MDANFWHTKWENNDISFHQDEFNPLLVRHFNALGLGEKSRIFIPLCGKTRDIAWLLANGYKVAGAELSKIAVEQLFTELGITARTSKVGNLERYSAANIDIFAGDIFDLSHSLLGPVDGIYDRAALVALPSATRRRYAAHVMQMTNNAPQLIICYEYDQSALNGPPFSVSAEEIHQHYAGSYRLSCIASTPLPGGLKGRCDATENTWLLKNG